MLDNIRDITRFLKKTELTEGIWIWHEEFGEGHNTYVQVDYEGSQGSIKSEHFTTGEEESLAAAKRRAAKFVESFDKKGYEVTNKSRY